MKRIEGSEMAKKIKVAVVGLGFGAEFVPIYQRHPDAECYAICQRNKDKGPFRQPRMRDDQLGRRVDYLVAIKQDIDINRPRRIDRYTAQFGFDAFGHE